MQVKSIAVITENNLLMVILINFDYAFGDRP